MVGTYSPLAKFIKQVHETGNFPYFHTVSFVGSDAFGKAILEQDVDPRFYKQIIVTQVVPAPYSGDLSLVVDYQKHLEKHFPDETPNYLSLEGYINARVLTQALQLAGRKPDREKLLNAFESMTNLSIGVDKPISFGKFDHVGFDGIFYSHLDEDGQFKIFEPADTDQKAH